MKRRITILNTLKSNVSIDLQPVVSELFAEIKDYFIKMDLFYHFNKNSYLFEAVYIQEKKMTEISNDLPLDSKSITKFVKDTEDFTKNLIHTYEKYKALIPYVNKK